MINNKYFVKKTGPPVETGRPLRLLDMRNFSCLNCAETTAYNGEDPERLQLRQLPVLLVTHLIVKLTLLRQVNQSTYTLIYYR